MAEAAASIKFLDADHVLTVAEELLRPDRDDRRRRLRAFFAPDEIDLDDAFALGAGLGEADGMAVVGPGEESPDGPGALALLLRRGGVSRAAVEAQPCLRLIQRLGSDSAGIDLVAARERGVEVSCLARKSLAQTAEHAILLLLSLAKRLPTAEAAVRSGPGGTAPPARCGDIAYNWPGLTGLVGVEGQTLGLVGMGEVATLVAARARAFGMRIVYCDRAPVPSEEALGSRFLPLEALMEEARFVSVHVPARPQTKGLIGAAELGRMRADAFLVNTSRGALIDEDALYEALAAGRIAGAALDVHAAEPRPPGDRFCRLDNVVLTPHLAGGSRLAVLAEIGAIFENLRAVLAGAPPPHGRVG